MKLAIVAGILVARHLKSADDLMDSRPNPRTEALIASATQWAERIMRRIEGVYSEESAGANAVGSSRREWRVQTLDVVWQDYFDQARQTSCQRSGHSQLTKICDREYFRTGDGFSKMLSGGTPNEVGENPLCRIDCSGTCCTLFRYRRCCS
jgi:hypothetical protein